MALYVNKRGIVGLSCLVGGWTNAQLFWIVKNGIKMTGMAPYGESLKDDEIWNVIAFVRKLPELTQVQYKQLEKDAP